MYKDILHPKKLWKQIKKPGHILPALIVAITRKARHLPEVRWADKDENDRSTSYVHNIFRVWEKFFWRKDGIRAEMGTTPYIDDKGRRAVKVDLYTFEAVLAHAETLIRGLFDIKWLDIKVTDVQFAMPVNTPELRIPWISFAIAHDADSKGTATGTSPETWTHTCTGSNLILLVGTNVAATTSPNASAVTYNSVTVNLAGSAETSAPIQAAIWYLTGPATGGNTVSVTFSGVTGLKSHDAAVSYSGASQSGQPDATAGNTGTSTNPSVTVTTVAANCWVAGVICESTTAVPTANLTEREALATSSATSHGSFQDTNASVAAGTGQAVGWTIGTHLWAIAAMSFAPVAGALSINVNDSTTTSEYVDVLRAGARNVNVNDATAATTESVKMTGQLGNINVNDAPSTSEYVNLTIVDNFSVFESEGPTTESVTLKIPNLGDISVNDTASHTESTPVAIPYMGNISVEDDAMNSQLHAVESVQLSMNLADIKVNDTEGPTTESVTMNLLPQPIVNDSTSTSESVTVKISNLGDISVNDTESTTESVSLNLSISINVNDATSTAESVTVQIANMGGIIVNDSTTVSEYTNFLVSPQQLITSNKSVATGTTTSATLADITGSSFNITLVRSGYIIAKMTAQIVSSASASTMGHAININSVDSTVISSYAQKKNSNETTMVLFRSGLLAAGTYTVTGRHQTSNGTLTTTNATLVAYCSIDNGGNPYATDYVTSTDTVSSSSMTTISGLTSSIANVVGGNIFAAVAGSATVTNASVTYSLGVLFGTEAGDIEQEAVSGNSDLATVAVASHTHLPTTSTPTTVVGQQAVSAGSATINPAQMTVISRRLTAFGQDWDTPTGHIETSGQSTSSASMADIPGSAVTITNKLTSHIVAHMTFSVQANTLNENGSFLINIDGTDYETIQHTFKDLNVPNCITIVTRTTSPLSPGDHTVKCRWAVSQGSATTMSLVGDLSTTSVAMETSTETPKIFASDSVTTSESVTTTIDENPNVSDTVGPIAESVSVALISGGTDISVYDNEGPTTEYVNVTVDLNPNVSDSTSTSESIVMAGTLGDISINDSTSTSEVVDLEVHEEPNVNDSTSTSEFVNLEVHEEPNVSDSTTTSESVTVAIPTLPENAIFDAVSTSEFVETSGQLGDIEVNESEGPTTEYTNVTVDLNLNVSDSTSASEFVDLNLSIEINVNDSPSTSEAVSLLVYFGDVTPSVFDTAITSEFVAVSIPTLPENAIVDTATLSEFVATGVIDAISVNDTPSVSESVSVNFGLQISVSDSVATAEFVNDLFNFVLISVSDSTVTAESIVARIQDFEAVFDAVSTSEFVAMNLSVQINVFDSTSLSDNFTPASEVNYILVFDSTATSESVNVSLPLGFSPYPRAAYGTPQIQAKEYVFIPRAGRSDPPIKGGI